MNYYTKSNFSVEYISIEQFLFNFVKDDRKKLKQKKAI